MQATDESFKRVSAAANAAKGLFTMCRTLSTSSVYPVVPCLVFAPVVQLLQLLASQVTSSINNLIIGKLYVEHTGIMRINNTQSSMVAKVKFKESGRLSSKDAHQVSQTRANSSAKCH